MGGLKTTKIVVTWIHGMSFEAVAAEVFIKVSFNLISISSQLLVVL